MDQQVKVEDDEDQLFLLEFLIEKLFLCADVLEDIQANEKMYVTKCVRLQFMTFAPMEVNDLRKDGKGERNPPPPQEEPGGTIFGFHRGKSCLFAMSGDKLIESIKNGPVSVVVGKKAPPSVLPEIIPVGENTFQLNASLANVVHEARKDPQKSPASHAVRDRFNLFNNASKERRVGWIEILFRLSCFSKLIVTQFELSNDKCFLFKGNEDDPAFQCRELGSDSQPSAMLATSEAKEKQKKCEVITAVLGGHALTIRIEKELKLDDESDCPCAESSEDDESEGSADCGCKPPPMVSAQGKDIVFEFPKQGKDARGFQKPKIAVSGIPSVQVDREKLDLNEKEGAAPGTKVYEICPKNLQGGEGGKSPFNLQLNTGAYSVSMDPKRAPGKGIFMQPQDNKDVTFRLSKTLDTPNSKTHFELELRPYREPPAEPILDKFTTVHEEIQCSPNDFIEKVAKPAKGGKGKKGGKKKKK